jgi:release factor glutamine methyltransferase
MESTIQEILAEISQQLHQYSQTPILEAQVLVAHILGKSRTWLLAHPDITLNNTQYNKIIQAANRLVHGEPLPYVNGHWEFYGMDFDLTPDVLIPRPETELIVERGINWLRLHPPRRKAVDVGTGSGCIGISLAKNIPDLRLLLTDISSQAINVARINAEKYKLLDRLEFLQADLLDGVARSFDLICANLPYIPTTLLMKLPVAEREPLVALDGGLSGTEVINRLLDQARGKLAFGGLMLLEIESSQGIEVKTLAKHHYPLSKVQLLKDLSGQDRCVEIERPNLIIHLCRRVEWQKSQEQGMYQGKFLKHEGFIHCSQPEQILEVANRFYPGISELVLLWMDPDKVASEIRWDGADNSLFPHIYGPINLDAVISVTELKPEIDGTYRVIQLPG